MVSPSPGAWMSGRRIARDHDYCCTDDEPVGSTATTSSYFTIVNDSLVSAAPVPMTFGISTVAAPSSGTKAGERDDRLAQGQGAVQHDRAIEQRTQRALHSNPGRHARRMGCADNAAPPKDS
jgi:hypothetical protein